MCTKIVKICNSKKYIYTNNNYNLGHGSKDLLDLLDLVGPILSRQTQIQLSLNLNFNQIEFEFDLAALHFLFSFFSAIEAVDYMFCVLRFYSVGHPITEISDLYK